VKLPRFCHAVKATNEKRNIRTRMSLSWLHGRRNPWHIRLCIASFFNQALCCFLHRDRWVLSRTCNRYWMNIYKYWDYILWRRVPSFRWLHAMVVRMMMSTMIKTHKRRKKKSMCCIWTKFFPISQNLTAICFRWSVFNRSATILRTRSDTMASSL